MKRQGGFTLLELVVAMTLMSVVLILLYNGLRLTTRAWDTGQQRAQRLNEIGLIQDFIRRQLQQSLTVFRSDTEQGRVVEFIGEPQRVTVIAPMLAHLGLGGLYVIELDTDESTGPGRLLMRWYPYRPAAQAGRDTEDKTVLLDNVTDVRWGYYGSEQDNQTPQWYDRWQSLSRRPILVRLSLKMQDAVWPDLIAALPD